MKRRIIKGQGGIPGIRPITKEYADSIYQAQQEIPYDEPWWSKAVRYIQNPFDIVSDYIEDSDWAPSWLKRSAPWVSFAASTIGGGPKKPKTSRQPKTSTSTSTDIPKKRGCPPRHDTPTVTQRRKTTLTKDERTKLLIEARGNPFDRSSGAMRVDKNGNFVFLDNVGRPVSSEYKRTPYGQSIYEKYLERMGQKPETPGAPETTGTTEKSLVSRGRPTKDAIEAKKQKFLTESYTPPKRSLVKGNGVRATWNNIHFNINLMFDEIASLRQQVKSGSTKLSQQLGEKRQALMNYLDEIDGLGWSKDKVVRPEGWDEIMQETNRAKARVRRKKKKK